MTNTEIDYLDGEFSVTESEPSTISEVADLIGEQGVVDEAVSNLRYRNKYPRVYRLVSQEVEKTFPREVKETKTNKDGSQRQVKISEMDHLRAYLATSDDARKHLAELFSSVAPAQALYVKGERAGGGGKISQGALDAANGFFAAGDEKVEKVISVIEQTVAGYKVNRDADGAATPESLARGIQALGKFQQKAAERQAVATLANA